MKLQTKIPLEKQSHHLIDYTANVLLLGSCFVEHIGEKLSYYKFQTLQNPFGILFHPKAIETLVAKAFSKNLYLETDIFLHDHQWHCFDSHSKLSATSKEKLIMDLNAQIHLTHQLLRTASHLVITLGTAWVYRFIETDRIVANCHKLPQKQFKKELLSIETITKTLNFVTDLVKSINPEVTIIFTVSPVRHLKDGFIENTQSKAHLIAAIRQLLSPRVQSEGLYYFPSYEIMMDELRDYRFYKEDMIHPNSTAVNIIWEKFQQVWISEKAYNTMDDVDRVQKGLKHKPFSQDSKAHIKFLQDLKNKKDILQQQFPHITF
ncbi:GSCFA domain-containing protein [Aestuariivivens sediminis]|uniref:GSCFA domain-containing protein n=1 Tax=Aestuariivivens sediminis TaxID=2913557 RepID=UPI001F572E78|nr:GSCFA domain-containing protein [Aestuariivivens sediminis]